MTSVSKIVAERSRRILMELVLKPGNDVCADCKARAPRWASYNLGIFICVSCASIHRKIGTHVTKVKSITLDEWTKEQVEVMKEKGNIKSNALYNPDEARHPPPTNMMDSERDSELEKFIRSKYEFKRFMNRKPSSSSQHLAADSRAAPTITLPRSTPLTNATHIEREASPPGPPLPPKTPENLPFRLRPLATIPSQNVQSARSFSHPLPPLSNSEKLTAVPPLRQHAVTQPSIQKPAGQLWDDLISLQEPSQSSSLPLQYSPATPFTPPSQPQMSAQQQPMLGTAQNPFMNLSLGQANATPPLGASPMSLSAQVPFVHSAPLSSPALHLSATNPFNQISVTASTTGTAFATSSSSFPPSTWHASMAASAPATPSIPPFMAFPTGTVLHTPPLSYGVSQTSAPAPGVSFPTAPFASGTAMGGLAPNPFAPVTAPGQMPLPTVGSTNPFSGMQMGQAGFPGESPRPGFGTTVFANHQQQQQQQMGPNAFGGWAGQGAHGTF